MIPGTVLISPYVMKGVKWVYWSLCRGSMQFIMFVCRIEQKKKQILRDQLSTFWKIQHTIRTSCVDFKRDIAFTLFLIFSNVRKDQRSFDTSVSGSEGLCCPAERFRETDMRSVTIAIFGYTFVLLFAFQWILLNPIVYCIKLVCLRGKQSAV